MRAADSIRDFFARLADTIAALRRRSEYNSGDCERSARCGLIESDRCIYRAIEVASGDWKTRRRDKQLTQW
jgi:hypothetical protein